MRLFLDLIRMLNKLILFENINIKAISKLKVLSFENLYEINKRKYLRVLIFLIRKFQEENFSGTSMSEFLYVERYVFEIKKLNLKFFTQYVENFNYRIFFGENIFRIYNMKNNMSIYKIRFNIYISINIIPLYKRRLEIDRKVISYYRDVFFKIIKGSF